MGERAQAEQIDFLNGMVILLFGLGLFFAGGSVLFDIGVDSTPDRETAAHNSDQRLVEDILARDPGSLTLDTDCVDAYFGMETNETCGLTDSVFNTSAPSENHWLRHSLGIEDDLQVNVTVRGAPANESQGDDASTVVHSLGPTPPADASVAVSNRIVAIEDDYETVAVRVW